MRLRRSEKHAEPFAFPGHPDVLDGHDAIERVERMASDVFVETPSPGDRPGTVLTGYALEGLRAASRADHLDAAASLTASAGKRLPFVVHLTGHARTRQAASAHGAHDDYGALADTGALLMFANTVQEAADFALIAHRAAEQALVPAVVAHDLYRTSHSVQSVRLPEPALVEDFLGRASDTIACPTEAQRIVFGDARRRVPVWLDVDHPAGIGGVQDGESYFRALAAQSVYFSDPLGAIVDDAMRELASRTGRAYQRLAAYRVDDADFVVVAQGAIVEELMAAVDRLRDARRMRAGVIGVTVLRPFPSAALSRLLERRKAVTVLERTDRALGGDTVLMRDVRAALDAAVENGRSPAGAPAYPDHATCRRLEDRPRLFSGVYGVGSDVPGAAEIAAVFENMAARESKHTFYLGARLDVNTRRFPHLQTLQQRIERAFPRLGAMQVDAAAGAETPEAVEDAFQLRSLSIQGGLFAGSLFAQAVADARGTGVRTFPDGGLERSIQPAVLTAVFGDDPAALSARPRRAGTTLVSGEMLLETLPPDDALPAGGTLIVSSVQGPETLWRGLSGRAAEMIRGHKIALYAIDARRIAEETASHPSFIDQLAIWALLGATTANGHGGQGFAECLRTRLGTTFANDPALIDEIVRTVERGAAELQRVPWESWQDVEHPVGEPEAPWTVRQSGDRDGTVFDPTRFWHSVGYLYDRGQSALALADPHLATGVIPARSSAFRDMAPYRLRLPEWIAGRCTGCGVCWAQCPESALPSTIRSLPELIDATARACEANGGPLIQMKRLGDQLAKQAYKLAAQDAPQPYETLASILEPAFERVVEKLGLDGEKLSVLRAEFERFVTAAGRFPVAVTPAFFAEPHRAQSGSGRLLSIALNPNSCTACGVCVEECPEDAFDWTAQSAEVLDERRRAWDFMMKLPAPAPGVVDAHVSADDPQTNLNRLLDPAVYHTLVGGDGSFPGNGAKTAVHLVTAAVESVMRPRFAAHVERLSGLIQRLEDKIQGKVDSTARINDFEDFGRRLTRLGPDALTAEKLRGIAAGDRAGQGLDADQLARLTVLLQSLREQRRAYTEGAGRSRMVLTIDADAENFWGGTYPSNPHAQPWAAHLPGDAAVLARGVWEGLTRRMAAELATCRRAGMELEDAYDPSRDGDALARLSWPNLTAEERALVPPVIVLGGAGLARTETIRDLAGHGIPIRFAAIDDDALTPVRVPAHSGAFEARASIGFPGHLMQNVIDALAFDGPARLHIYAPDPVADGLAAGDVAAQATLATRCRAVPLFTLHPEGDGSRLSIAGNPDADRDWTAHEILVHAPSGADAHVAAPLTPADWAVREARYRPHFRVVSPGGRSAQLRRLADYLALAPEERDGIEAYVDVRDGQGRHALAVVSPDMIRASEQALAAWRDLRAMAHAEPAPAPAVAAPGPAAPQPEAPTAAAASVDTDALRTLTENLLRMAGYGRDDAFFARSLREFVVEDNKEGSED